MDHIRLSSPVPSTRRFTAVPPLNAREEAAFHSIGGTYLGSGACHYLGRLLKQFYDHVLAAPLPSHMQTILNQLDAAERQGLVLQPVHARHRRPH